MGHFRRQQRQMEPDESPMQIYKPLRSSIQRFRAHLRSLRMWVLEVYAWWVLGFGSREDRIELRREVAEARREVRELIFLTMVSRMTFQRQARRWMRPPSARSGFRYAQRRFNMMRLYTRGIRLRTLRDIRDVLKNFERIVEKAIARVPKRMTTGRLLLRSVGAPAHVTPSTSLADEAVRAPDTS
jgi:hypothetical protein